ncbi:hypothetical protein V1515DRAFT_598129 [Lipomyces mesembrius]
MTCEVAEGRNSRYLPSRARGAAGAWSTASVSFFLCIGEGPARPTFSPLSPRRFGRRLADFLVLTLLLLHVHLRHLELSPPPPRTRTDRNCSRFAAMSGYFALDYSAPMQPPLPLALEAEMLLFSSSTPSPSTSSDFTFVEQFSLATSPAASMSPGACSPFDRVHRDLDPGSRASFIHEPSDQASISTVSSDSSIHSVNATSAGINPRIFFSRAMSDGDEDDVVGARSLNDFQFRPLSGAPTTISTTSEPSPSSSSAQSPFSASTSRPVQNQKRAARRPTLTSSRSAPSVPQTQSLTLTAGVAPTKNAAGKFQCAQCSRSYLHAKHLKRHMLRHTGDRPYKCSLCSDSFCRSDILKRHYEKCQHRRANAKFGTGRIVSCENASADDQGDRSSACDECVGAGIRCAREDGLMCVQCGQVGATCSIGGMVLDVPQSQNPSPPPQQQYQYLEKSEILDDDETEPVVFPIPPNEFQLPMPMQPQSHMYDFNLLSYYPDMVETQMQAHVQSPMQFYA